MQLRTRKGREGHLKSKAKNLKDGGFSRNEDKACKFNKNFIFGQARSMDINNFGKYFSVCDITLEILVSSKISLCRKRSEYCPKNFPDRFDIKLKNDNTNTA